MTRLTRSMSHTGLGLGEGPAIQGALPPRSWVTLRALFFTLRALFVPTPTFYKHQVARCTIPPHTTFFPSLRLRVPEPRPWQRLVFPLPLVLLLGPTQLPPPQPTSTQVLASSPVTWKELVASCPSRPNSSPRLPPKSASLSRQENLSSSPSCVPLSTL